MEGSVNLQLSAKSVGLFEAFYNSLKPVQLLNRVLEVALAGKPPAGTPESLKLCATLATLKSKVKGKKKINPILLLFSSNLTFSFFLF